MCIIGERNAVEAGLSALGQISSKGHFDIHAKTAAAAAPPPTTTPPPTPTMPTMNNATTHWRLSPLGCSKQLYLFSPSHTFFFFFRLLLFLSACSALAHRVRVFPNLSSAMFCCELSLCFHFLPLVFLSPCPPIMFPHLLS